MLNGEMNVYGMLTRFVGNLVFFSEQLTLMECEMYT